MTDDEARARLRAARFVAEHWLDAWLTNAKLGYPYAAMVTHPLAMVLAAMDGETDPVHVGLDPGAHDAFRALLAEADA